jgi:hypothetical protein
MKKFWMSLLCLVCFRLFGQDIPYGMELQIDDLNDGYRQTDPVIAPLLNGNYVVCWITSYNYGAQSKIYGQVFSSMGLKVGNKLCISSTSESEIKPQFLRMVTLKNSNFIVYYITYWQSQGYGGSKIYGQLFSSDGTKIGNEYNIATSTEDYTPDPTIASLSNNDLVICWPTDYQQGGYGGISGQVFSSNFVKVGEIFNINIYTSEVGFHPRITTLPNNNFVICWSGWYQDSDRYDVFAQQFSATGSKIGEKFQVNTYSKNDQTFPIIASITNDGYVVCWIGESYFELYGQLFGSDGSRIGKEFRVNSSSSYAPLANKIIIPTDYGFIFCWESFDHNSSDHDIYGQVFSLNGEKVGNEFLVNSHTNGFQRNPQVAPLPNGDFVVCWQSDPEGVIYCQQFTWDGNKIGGEFRINSNPEIGYFKPQIVLLSNGDFVVCFESYYNNDTNIYAKLFPHNPILHTLIPFILLEPSNDNSIKITNPILSWHQPSSQIVCYPWELHYKIFLDDNPDFSSSQIIEQDQDTILTLQNLTPGKTYFWKVLAKNIAGDSLWSSNTNAFFVTQDATGVQENQTSSPYQFVLHQNYPNPFNPETTIRFDLPETGDIEISIYDISGKLVKVLINEFCNSGSHSVKWDGKDSASNAMPSGIYICRMEAKTANGKTFVQIVKMGLVR